MGKGKYSFTHSFPSEIQHLLKSEIWAKLGIFVGDLTEIPCVFISFLGNWGETPNIFQVNSVKTMNILVGNLRET